MSTGPYGSPYYDGKQVGQLASGVTSSPMMVVLNLGMGRYGGPLLVPGESLNEEDQPVHSVEILPGTFLQIQPMRTRTLTE